MKGENIATRLRLFAAGVVRLCRRRPDFIHKLGIANKELRESLYWLQLAQEAALVVESELAALVREADELVAILTTSIKTAKRHEATSCREDRTE